MKFLRKNLFITFSIILISCIFIFVCINTRKANAQNNILTKNVSVNSIANSSAVSNYGVLYNVDDSADYYYVTFNQGGYAIFSSLTHEMLEYTLDGELPYSQNNEKNITLDQVNIL